MRNEYELDSSAIIHLATREKDYSNSFRLSATLTETVRPSLLQDALAQTAPCFPTMVAGIRRRANGYRVTPSETPQVQPDLDCLAPMSRDMIERCALRVLYGERHIAVEIFHSLTDGHGGMVFLTALLQNYLSLVYGDICPRRTPGHLAQELKDDYITYAAGKAAPARLRRYYCPAGNASSNAPVQATTAVFDLPQMLCAARRFQVSLTAFLTAALAVSIAESQPGRERRPVQIMVPVDLRRKFMSQTVRNFSLYALPVLEPDWVCHPFRDTAEHIGRQMAEQTSKEALAAAMASSVGLQDMPFVRLIPPGVKEMVLRMGHGLLETSCLTLSNLGEVTFPAHLRPYIREVGFILTPRRRTQYNCSVLSYQGRLSIIFSRRGEMEAWEQRFWQYLENMGCRAIQQEDGLPSCFPYSTAARTDMKKQVS